MIGGLLQSRAARAQKSRSIPRSLPAPIGGWNARDSLADMDPRDAVSLINMFPSLTSVACRSGYTQFATGFPGQVETVMAYNGSTTNKLIGISNGSVYDATAGGAVGAAAVSGLTNSRWQYTNLATAGGNYIEMCNGVDGVYTFDGTSWVNQTGSITGVGPGTATLNNINQHKNRLWFCDSSTLKAWYLPTASITGAANSLDLSEFAPRGGFLMAMATWTVDGGVGMDDLAVFITNRGDVIVYRGTDPSSASTWALVGVYQIGAPIGRRCFMKWKGDLLVITTDGLVPLSQALLYGRINSKFALTDKILSKMTAAVQSYQGNFGWQIMSYPKQQMLILNIPVTTGNGQQQYVMNTISGAWCSFQGWNANCWELYVDDIYFGGNTYIAKAWNTSSDNGSAIFVDALQAFSYFGNEGQVKRFTMMRPTFYINSSQTINANINIDFDQSAPSSSVGTTTFSGSTWDSGVWDTALWTDTLSLSNQWQGTTGVGWWGAPHIQSNLTATLQWLATDVVLEPGGIL